MLVDVCKIENFWLIYVVYNNLAVTEKPWSGERLLQTN